MTNRLIPILLIEPVAARLEASLEPYREQLDAAFCLSNAGIEMDPDSGRALYIALY